MLHLNCYFQLDRTWRFCFVSGRYLVLFPTCRPAALTGYISDEVQLIRYSDSLRAGLSGDRVPVGARFSTPVQTGPAAHPASYTMGTVSFAGVKRPGRGVDQTPPSSAEVKERVELKSVPPLDLHGLFWGELFLTHQFDCGRFLLDPFLIIIFLSLFDAADRVFKNWRSGKTQD